MADYTPTDDVVLRSYADWELNSDLIMVDPLEAAARWNRRADEFRRWLAEHDAKLRTPRG